MIRVEHLSKSFGLKLAVNDVSFAVEPGEVLGFLGPNGAGKSTTMRMVTGFIPPTSGKITVGGYDVLEQPIPAKRLVGYLPENAPGYADNTQRVENREVIDELVAEWCATQQSAELAEVLLAAGLAATVVNEYRDLAEEAHIAERDMLVDVELSEVVGGAV